MGVPRDTVGGMATAENSWPSRLLYVCIPQNVTRDTKSFVHYVVGLTSTIGLTQD